MEPSRKGKGFTAWLITWEHMGERARPPERIAAVLGRRRAERQVAELLEFLYAHATLSPSEKLALATGQFLRGRGRMLCGHNPHLKARVVDNLRVRPKPSNPDVARQLKA